MRLFMSASLHQAAPALAAYANRVQAMLDTYESLSHGKITLEVIDPKPYSDEEDRAVGLGINRISLDGTSDPIYFGLAATNSTNGSANIPVFSPDREAFLEYDLTRLVAELGQTKKPVVALLDGLGMAGNPMTGQEPAQILSMLKETYTVETVSGDIDKLPDNTRVVLVVQPQGLSDRTLYTLDQWVLGGGATMVFADPFRRRRRPASSRAVRRRTTPPTSRRCSMPGASALMRRRRSAIPTGRSAPSANIDGRQAEVANYPWFAIHDDGFDRGDAVTSKLQAIVMTTAGSFTATGTDVKLKPRCMPLRRRPAAGRRGRRSLRRSARAAEEDREGRVPSGGRRRLEGKLKTAFPNGKPKVRLRRDDALKESAGAPNVIVCGDADMLSDRNWLQKQNVLGRQVAQAFANNGDFLLNAVEQMVGGVALADLRSRTVSWRPFNPHRRAGAGCRGALPRQAAGADPAHPGTPKRRSRSFGFGRRQGWRTGLERAGQGDRQPSSRSCSPPAPSCARSSTTSAPTSTRSRTAS